MWRPTIDTSDDNGLSGDCRVHLTHLTKVFVYHNDEDLEQENSVKCAAIEANMAGECLEMHFHVHL
jgi:hypothetical protein